jgi:hypothetical protein
VAGVAWAQHKGVAAVEVRVDGGPWHEARLAAVPDIDTWRQWVWEWPATPGTHVLEARATDATGYTQTAVQAQPVPNGASGYPSATVTVRSSLRGDLITPRDPGRERAEEPAGVRDRARHRQVLLTPLGESLCEVIETLRTWAYANAGELNAARQRYVTQNG